MNQSLIDNVLDNMVEVEFVDGDADGFPKVKETLQRIGIPSPKTKTLYQTAHILHKQGRYYICHFKEMFSIDGRETTISETDLSRRNLIVQMLEQWELVKAKTDSWKTNVANPRSVKVLRHSDRDDWTLAPKYKIGSR